VRSLAIVALLAGCGTAHFGTTQGPGAVSARSGRSRLAAVMWPTAKSVIACTRRIDDQARPVGVAGPCAKLEAGENDAVKVISWATLGRFDDSAPDSAPASMAGRCRFEIEDAQGRQKPAKLWWVTPTKRQELAAWTPGEEKGVAESDAFTIEVSLAPEGEWLAILRVAVGLGEGERIVQVASMNLTRVPACE
jgi:hypothetical protein